MASSANRGLVGLLRRGWIEIPEVIGSSIMALIGVGIGITAIYMYYDNDGDNRKYKEEYTVIRHDDPKVEKLKNYVIN